MSKFNRWWILKPAVFLASSVPIGWLLFDTFTGNLTANPLEDIRNTRKISAVVLGGKYYPRAELDKMLSQVESLAKQ